MASTDVQATVHVGHEGVGTGGCHCGCEPEAGKRAQDRRLGGIGDIEYLQARGAIGNVGHDCQLMATA